MLDRPWSQSMGVGKNERLIVCMACVTPGLKFPTTGDPQVRPELHSRDSGSDSIAKRGDDLSASPVIHNYPMLFLTGNINFCRSLNSAQSSLVTRSPS